MRRGGGETFPNDFVQQLNIRGNDKAYANAITFIFLNIVKKVRLGFNLIHDMSIDSCYDVLSNKYVQVQRKSKLDQTTKEHCVNVKHEKTNICKAESCFRDQ